MDGKFKSEGSRGRGGGGGRAEGMNRKQVT